MRETPRTHDSSPPTSTTCSVPYRVVVHKVIEWTTKGFYERGRAILVEIDDDVPEEVFHPANPYEDVETRFDLERALAKLLPGDREVARMRLVDGYEIERVAELRKPLSASLITLKDCGTMLSKRKWTQQA